MIISESSLIEACLSLGLIRWAYSAFLYRRAARRLSRSGADSWPAAIVVIVCAARDEGTALRIRSLLSEPYPGQLEFRLHAPGSEAEGMLRFAGRFQDERLRR